MRLDKFVANNSSYSRSQVRALLKSGRLSVNGHIPKTTSLVVHAHDRVMLDGKAVDPAQEVYWMMHKPSGYVCANHDAEHPTVIDLLSLDNMVKPLQIAGRLDIDTSGLVLLTTNGQWNHKVTSPRQHCGKSYKVECAEPISPSCVSAIESGMRLRNESRETQPAKIVLLSATQASLTIYEGMYHQVKRMFAANGNKVIALHRYAIGPITLDEKLAPGKSRALLPEEIAAFL